ncbi:hypothetical protein BJ684DRAFT_16240 [Piptocephalis cylindrospora]|uniref:Uncharacterized protein n=1 Tax=Piptocephalis cylindrospora TaxID=1907219 RepID=A0A4P9Y589_9FUNG|nr:hypothetical protein BJ684DRAFT_16501 [Piptocephalis cylindrospora]RKP13351.1 hypothetical protein BJ684DRAFT_16240 [Piptocephalis cylindrospora]|eukprot:RKP13060.1 hypothetical protein BJ684DRAFT_16501 [Piptocephalis cylindrospora]
MTSTIRIERPSYPDCKPQESDLDSTLFLPFPQTNLSYVPFSSSSNMGNHKNAVNSRSVNRLKRARQARQAKKCARLARGVVGKREAAVHANDNLSEKKKRLLLTAAKHAIAREASKGQVEGEITMADVTEEMGDSMPSKRKSAAFKEEEVVAIVKTGRGTTLGGPSLV